MSTNLLFGIYVLMILATRVPLLFWHRHAPKIGSFQLHHYMYGVVLVLAYFFIPQPVLLAMGLGLIVDELPLFFLFKTWDWPDDHWSQYHSAFSVWSIVIISLVGYFAL